MKFLTSLLSAAQGADKALDIEFVPSRFLDMLQYMGKGMLVIFVIIGVIILATVLINKLFSKK